jgi:hypothetical protein
LDKYGPEFDTNIIFVYSSVQNGFFSLMEKAQNNALDNIVHLHEHDISISIVDVLLIHIYHSRLVSIVDALMDRCA